MVMLNVSQAVSASSPEARSSLTGGPIIFFDGECGLCDRFVQFVLRHDPGSHFRFAPLQGKTFSAYRAELGRTAENTVVLLDEQGFHVRSRAAFRVLSRLGWPWSALGRAGRLIPRPLADLGYRLVARLRYWLFGKVNACIMPAMGRDRFLP